MHSQHGLRSAVRLRLTLPQGMQDALAGFPYPAGFSVQAVDAARLGPTSTDQSRAFFYVEGWQWNMKRTLADIAWKNSRSKGGLGETVCILDTGIDPNHMDLAGRVDPAKLATMIAAPRFPSDATPLDYDFHGTAVAAIVTSNGRGVGSTAPDATLCSIKVLSQDGQGMWGDVVEGIVAAASTPYDADVINLSLGGPLFMSVPADAAIYRLVQAAVQYAFSKGASVVASEGNDGLILSAQPIPYKFVVTPAMVPGVVGVGATGPRLQQNFDVLTLYSNRGTIEVMDIVAPGGNGATGNLRDGIISACSQYSVHFNCSGGNAYLQGLTGTSFSAPMASGAAAVAESTVGAPMTPGAVALCLRRTARRGGPPYDPAFYGAGGLMVFGVLSCTQFG